MNIALTPMSIFVAFCFGSLTAYIAFKRKKNPYLWFGIGFALGTIGLFAIFFLPDFKKKRARNTSKKMPIAVLNGPKEKMWYYLDPEHKQMGPISYNAICKKITDKIITPTTYVWHEELKDWQKIESLIQVSINEVSTQKRALLTEEYRN